MVKSTAKGVSILFSVTVSAIFLYGLYLFYYSQNPEELLVPKKDKVAQLLVNLPEKPLQLDQRTKTVGCEAKNSLPDHACTPGAVFSEATKEQICVEGYTKTVRKVSTTLRKKVYQEYGVSYPQPFGAYEVDHMIPLALGGNNDIANLFLEAADPKPGFREKDVVEIFLQQEVCEGRISLPVAQAQIVNDWLLVYNNLSTEQIQQIKQKFNNWSN